jgi:hypothetical protein
MNSSLRSISHNQQSLKCGKHYVSFSFLHSFFVWVSPVMMKTQNYLRSSMDRVALLVSQAGPDAYQILLLLVVSSKEAWSNNRFRFGIAVGMMAFHAWKCHSFFDINVRDYNFYYINWVFYFHEIRPYMCGIFLATGFFIAAPMKWGFKWWSLPVVIFCGTQIYEMSNYHDYSDFHKQMPDWQFFTVFAFAVVSMYFSMNYLLYRKYHLKDGNAARVMGIMQLDIPWDEKKKHLETLKEEMENYNARI